MPENLAYILLVFALFVLPQLLSPFRLPNAVTSLALGATCGIGFALFRQESTISLLAVFGIVSLFLFAGLEVDLRELRQHARLLIQHLVLRGLSIIAVGILFHVLLGLEWRAAVMVSLSLLTPSCGFIFSSLDAFGLSAEDRFMVKIKAIAAELLALAVLFFCSQGGGKQLLVSVVALVAVIGLLPLALWLFARYLLKRAPRSEFAFLIVLAVICAYTTKLMGAYYLLGAFLAGVVAQRTRSYVPELVSPRILDAVELFASFFIPFYFFHAGLELKAEDFSVRALGFGAILVAVVLPSRMVVTMLHRRLALGKSPQASFRVATALLPTLVFTLVLTQILRERFQVPEYLLGGLIIYTLVSTVLPGLVLVPKKTPDYTAPEAAPAPEQRTPLLARNRHASFGMRFDLDRDRAPPR